MSGSDLTILVALAAGLLSFLSPCVLPLVPAYIGQLTAIAVAAGEPGARPSRWIAVRQSLAYVAGFGAVFTVLGITATFMAGPLADYLAALRIVGGALLIVLGLNLAGILHIPVLERTWRPLEAGASGSLATATGTVALGSGSGSGTASVGDRMGARMVSPRGGWIASFGLGAIFAVGWTPCIGIILGGDPDDGRDLGHHRPGRDPAASPTRSGSGSRSSASRWSTTARRASSARWCSTARRSRSSAGSWSPSSASRWCSTCCRTCRATSRSTRPSR